MSQKGQLQNQFVVCSCFLYGNQGPEKHAILSGQYIGHAKITHSNIFTQDNQLVYSACQNPYAVNQLLTECIDVCIYEKTLPQDNVKDSFNSINRE